MIVESNKDQESQKQQFIEQKISDMQDIKETLDNLDQQTEKEHHKQKSKQSEKGTYYTEFEQEMLDAGIDQSDFDYVKFLVKHESNFDPKAVNPDTGAYGYCQALPGEKMSKFGDDWKTNPVTQLKWCNSYALDRYGSWERAYVFWLNNGWW